MALYGKSQIQILLDDINLKNGSAVEPLTVDNCIIGKPRVLVQKKVTDPNTEVTIRGRQLRGYVGPRTFQYTRLNLADLFKNMKAVITLPAVTTTLQALPNINGRYGLNFLSTDLVNYGLSAGRSTYLRATDTCLQYYGQTTITYSPGKYVLDELIVNNSLDVLSHPIPVTDKLCAPMISYGVDFTDHAPLLQAFTAGSMSVGGNLSNGYSASLVALMVTMGFPEWDFTAAQFKIVTTASQPWANKSYDRAALITNINDRNLGGDLYLHFNI